MSSLRHVNALDGLRGCAVLSVVAFHAALSIYPGGWVGVDVFFVLSGFLITSGLRRELDETGRVRLGAFYKRRFFRLGPALILLLLANIVWARLFPAKAYEIYASVLATAFYAMNWVSAYRGPEGLLGHAWSLSVEEQFYLVWPVMIWFFWTRRPVRWVAGLYIAAVVWRLLLWHNAVSGVRLYNGSDTHCDGLMLGSLLAVTPIPDNIRAASQRFAWVPAVGLVGMFQFFYTGWPNMMATVGMTIAPIFAAWALLACLGENWLSRALSVSPLRFIGRISYGWYLWHLPLILVARQLGFTVEQAVVGSFLIAVASFHVVESPILAWSKKHREAASLQMQSIVAEVTTLDHVREAR